MLDSPRENGLLVLKPNHFIRSNTSLSQTFKVNKLGDKIAKPKDLEVTQENKGTAAFVPHRYSVRQIIYKRTGVEVDFDFTPSGEVGGFDAWRLWQFAKQFSSKYTKFQTLDDVENALKDATKNNLVRPSGTNSDRLFYLA